MYAFTLCTASCDLLYGHLRTGRTKPYGGCAEIVRKLCDAGAAAMQSLQILHGNRTTLVGALYRGHSETVRCTVTVRGPYDDCKIFLANMTMN